MSSLYEQKLRWLNGRYIKELDFDKFVSMATPFLDKSKVAGKYDYVKLCKLGGKYPFTKLLEKAHLNNPFVNGTVKKAVKPLKKYLAEFDVSKF